MEPVGKPLFNLQGVAALGKKPESPAKAGPASPKTPTTPLSMRQDVFAEEEAAPTSPAGKASGEDGTLKGIRRGPAGVALSPVTVPSGHRASAGSAEESGADTLNTTSSPTAAAGARGRHGPRGAAPRGGEMDPVKESTFSIGEPLERPRSSGQPIPSRTGHQQPIGDKARPASAPQEEGEISQEAVPKDSQAEGARKAPERRRGSSPSPLPALGNALLRSSEKPGEAEADTADVTPGTTTGEAGRRDRHGPRAKGPAGREMDDVTKRPTQLAGDALAPLSPTVVPTGRGQATPSKQPLRPNALDDELDEVQAKGGLAKEGPDVTKQPSASEGVRAQVQPGSHLPRPRVARPDVLPEEAEQDAQKEPEDTAQAKAQRGRHDARGRRPQGALGLDDVVAKEAGDLPSLDANGVHTAPRRGPLDALSPDQLEPLQPKAPAGVFNQPGKPRHVPAPVSSEPLATPQAPAVPQQRADIFEEAEDEISLPSTTEPARHRARPMPRQAQEEEVAPVTGAPDPRKRHLAAGRKGSLDTSLDDLEGKPNKALPALAPATRQPGQAMPTPTQVLAEEKQEEEPLAVASGPMVFNTEKRRAPQPTKEQEEVLAQPQAAPTAVPKRSKWLSVQERLLSKQEAPSFSEPVPREMAPADIFEEAQEDEAQIDPSVSPRTRARARQMPRNAMGSYGQAPVGKVSANEAKQKKKEALEDWTSLLAEQTKVTVEEPVPQKQARDDIFEEEEEEAGQEGAFGEESYAAGTGFGRQQAAPTGTNSDDLFSDVKPQFNAYVRPVGLKKTRAAGMGPGASQQQQAPAQGTQNIVKKWQATAKALQEMRKKDQV